jgi:hypothetical protein
MTRIGQVAVLWGLAIGLPLLLVVGVGEVFWRITNRSRPGDGDVLLWQLGLTALPFVVLAVLGTLAPDTSRARMAAGIAGSVMACALWGYYYVDGYRYWRDHLAPGTPPGGGVDFGVAFLMLFSPVLIGMAMAAAHRFSTVRQRVVKPE